MTRFFLTVLLPLVLPPTVLGFYLLVLLGPLTGFGRALTSLLGHPLYCPHGSPIPQGECCVEKRVLDHAEIANVLSSIKSI